MKKTLAAILVTAIISGGIYFIMRQKKNPDELIVYGNVEIRQVDMSFQVSGKILKMFKEEGDSVKKGELLAALDDRDYSANLEKSSAEVKRSKAAWDKAFKEYKRKLPLCSDNTVSKLECDNLFSAKNEAEASYLASRAVLKNAQNNLYYTKIYAPDNGIITVRVLEPGANAGVGQSVYTLAKNTPVWIRTYIPETNLGNVKYGMKAKVLTDSVNPQTGKKLEYTGWVGYISPVAEFTPKTVQTEDLRTDLVYRIRVYVYDTDEYLRLGMPTTVVINLKEKEMRIID